MPTVVSTFGNQIGTLWHVVGSEGVKFDFVNLHRMEHIIAGFASSTGQPKEFRQMRDWPQADYSQFGSFSNVVSNALHTTLKVPFDILNAIYKNIKTTIVGSPQTSTWYEQIVQKHGQVESYLHATEKTDRYPDFATLTTNMNLAIQGHYVPLSPIESMKKINLCHFAENEQRILQEIYGAREAHPDLGWHTVLENRYTKSGVALLHAFTLNKEKTEVVLKTEYSGSIFEFQNDLHELIKQKGEISFERFMTGLLQETRNELKKLQSGLSQLPQLEVLQQKVNAFEKAVQSLQQPSEEPAVTTISIRTAIALEKAGMALRPLSIEDFQLEQQRNDHLISLMRELKPGQSLEMDCARADELGGVACVGTSEAIITLYKAGLLHSQQDPKHGKVRAISENEDEDICQLEKKKREKKNQLT